MKNMNRKIVVLLAFLLGGFAGYSQLSSPYSQFGAGDVKPVGFGQSRGMGGIGIGMHSGNFINNLNPASYTHIDSMTVLYEVGFSGMINEIASSSASQKKYGTSIDYLAIRFRLSPKFSTGFGLQPLSEVDYKVSSQEHDAYIGDYSTVYSGSGGLNKAYLTFGYKATEDLSFGLSGEYTFGAIDKMQMLKAEEISMYNTQIDYRLNTRGYHLTAGVQYDWNLNKKQFITFGAKYQLKTKVKTSIDRIGGSVNGSEIGDISDNTLVDTLVNENDVTSTAYFPASVGFGVSYNIKNKLVLGLDAELQQWSDADFGVRNMSYNDRLSVRTGLAYTPNHNHITNYFKRATYCLGGFYNNGQISINNQRINDYGITFGVDLPLRRKTSFTVTGTIGQRGTKDSNLLQETYGILGISLSLSDIWFIKRKYN
jgi:hypothetical protein